MLSRKRYCPFVAGTRLAVPFLSGAPASARGARARVHAPDRVSEGGHMKKLLLATLLLVAPIVRAQDPAPAAPALDGTERKFAGEIVSTDVPAKTMTVKASGVDSRRETVEKTLTLGVADNLVDRLGTLNAGDKLMVVWKKDDATQKEVVVAFAKATEPPSDKQDKQ